MLINTSESLLYAVDTKVWRQLCSLCTVDGKLSIGNVLISVRWHLFSFVYISPSGVYLSVRLHSSSRSFSIFLFTFHFLNIFCLLGSNHGHHGFYHDWKTCLFYIRQKLVVSECRFCCIPPVIYCMFVHAGNTNERLNRKPVWHNLCWRFCFWNIVFYQNCNIGNIFSHIWNFSCAGHIISIMGGSTVCIPDGASFWRLFLYYFHK